MFAYLNLEGLFAGIIVLVRISGADAVLLLPENLLLLASLYLLASLIYSWCPCCSGPCTNVTMCEFEEPNFFAIFGFAICGTIIFLWNENFCKSANPPYIYWLKFYKINLCKIDNF